VEQTKFSDDTEVTANFGENILVVNGKTIGRPEKIPC